MVGVETTLLKLRGQTTLAYQGQTTLAYQRMIPRGPFDRDLAFLDRVPKAEIGALFAYLNNRDLQQQPRPIAQRVIIDVYDALCNAGLGTAEANAQESWLKVNFPTLLQEIRQTVQPKRAALAGGTDDEPAIAHWWLFQCSRPELRAACRGLDRVIVIGRVGKCFAPTHVRAAKNVHGLPICLSDATVVVPTSSSAVVGLANSKVPETQVRRFCSSLQTQLRFTPSEVFPYFPFPWKGEPTGLG